MRALLALLFAFGVSSCAQMPVGAPKLPAEAFTCTAEPPAWAADADDVAIAVNETKRTEAGRACRQQLKTVCRVLSVNGQVIGECPANEAR